MISFSSRLKELRKNKGVTQKQVAEILEISERNYRRYESGEIDPLTSNTIKLANYFNVSVDYLLGHTDNPVIH